MKYVVVGYLVGSPTEAQMKLAENTGGWKTKTINKTNVLWNACVSIPAFQSGYKF